MKIHFLLSFRLAAAFAGCALSLTAADPGFRPLFDGTSLAGWKSSGDASYWSVQDGAITARSTEDHPCSKNQFLVWEDGRVDDFELKLKFRIRGTDRANSGIQIRSEVHEDGHLQGYQADLSLSPQWTGVLYDEHTGRKVLAGRGMKTTISKDGTRTQESFGEADALIAGFRPDDWNDYHITARGGHIVLRVNGRVTAEVMDSEEGQRDLAGVLAVQLHSGPPMTVQFKDIQLKRLPLSDDRRKIVFLAGKPSHRPGDHEHNAGCLLLADCLEQNHGDQVITAVHLNNGWPADPTAFDNADAVVIYCDGGERHLLMPHLDALADWRRRGIGVGCLHYAVEVPKGEAGEGFLQSIGGYFETYYSVNPHWVGDFKKLPSHPIARGVKPYSINDEWYYHMRFPQGMKEVTPILSAVPPDNTRTDRWGHHHGGNEHVKARMGMPEVVMWAKEDSSGARGFGFTGGHYHKNWADPNQRKIVLNAILWLTGMEVPQGGVDSTVEKGALEKNLDDKPTPAARRKAKK